MRPRIWRRYAAYAFDEAVLAQEVVDHLAEHAAGEWDVVALPFAHAQIAAHHVVVVDVVEQIGCARQLAERAQRAQRVLHPVSRHVAVVLDQRFFVEAFAHPRLERHQAVAVHRRRHAGEVPERR